MVDKLHAMQVFTKVVDTNSFSRTADLLHMSRASVSTTIQALEASLKVRLLHRTTRHLSLTPDGAAYYERCVRIVADVEEAESSFSNTTKAARGKLRVDMPGSIGRLIVVPALDEFQTRYPEIDLMLGLGDRPIDLIQEGVDCVIRVGELQDSTLVARRVGTFQIVTAASPEYLHRHGKPQTVSDLQDHLAVNYFSGRTGRVVDMEFVVDGKLIDVKMRSKLAANDADAYLNCGVKGLGLIQIPHLLARSHLENGELVEVLPQWKPLPMPISAVYPHNRHLSLQVRAFVDWITELFERCPLLTYQKDGIGALRSSGSATSRPNSHSEKDQEHVPGITA
jgi:LysR family transcriptional regulator, regulator for bpeEF and oprC